MSAIASPVVGTDSLLGITNFGFVTSFDREALLMERKEVRPMLLVGPRVPCVDMVVIFTDSMITREKAKTPEFNVSPSVGIFLWDLACFCLGAIFTSWHEKRPSLVDL